MGSLGCRKARFSAADYWITKAKPWLSVLMGAPLPQQAISAGPAPLHECPPPIAVRLNRAVVATAEHVFQRLRPCVAQLPAVAEIAAIASTHQCHVESPHRLFSDPRPHVIPPRMLSVIRDQGPCDLWGMSTTRDWRLLTSGSKGIS